MTGRDIFEVNVEEIKSKWVGETESNIRHMFRQYYELCKSQPVVPILLFNEADAILGKRKEGAETGVDKMENSLQNIILQEMERLEGIMIATTNLTENLDKAFERRFIYKVQFKKPETDVKAKIWKSMLPDLTDEEAAVLARRYDMSGGMIENITRKKSVTEIITGNYVGFDMIREMCDDETIVSSRKVVGF
jgi:SpoVK/Ycf46/Vps4 family AAA+-type ATPase